MRRHLKRAEFHQATPAGRTGRVIHLVDAEFRAVGVAGHVRQDVAEQPVGDPGCHRLLRPDLRERDLKLGQAVLARLIDAGVQFVTVTDGGWDTHTNNFKSLKDRLMPRVDRGLSALVEDLDARGMLDDTLVVWFGDFGRTPKVNPTAGRDHWATAGVAVMAGGGVKVGQVVGKTNALAEVVTDTPVSPQDIAATIYTTLGINLHTWYKAQDGRPIELCPEGKPVKELVG